MLMLFFRLFNFISIQHFNNLEIFKSIAQSPEICSTADWQNTVEFLRDFYQCQSWIYIIMLVSFMINDNLLLYYGKLANTFLLIKLWLIFGNNSKHKSGNVSVIDLEKQFFDSCLITKINNFKFIVACIVKNMIKSHRSNSHSFLFAPLSSYCSEVSIIHKVFITAFLKIFWRSVLKF